MVISMSTISEICKFRSDRLEFELGPEHHVRHTISKVESSCTHWYAEE